METPIAAGHKKPVNRKTTFTQQKTCSREQVFSYRYCGSHLLLCINTLFFLGKVNGQPSLFKACTA